MITDDVRAALRQRVEERGTHYSMEFTETEAVELASGFVCAEVRAKFLAMLAWMDDDRRAADRNAADDAKARRRGEVPTADAPTLPLEPVE